MHEWVLLHRWLCNQKHPWGICSCSPIVNFLNVTFYHGMVTLVIFLIKKNNLNRHIKHENLLSIYENMDYFQIMLFTVTCWKFHKIQQPYIKRYFYVFFSSNIVEILLKLRAADASSGFGAVKAFLQDHHHHHHHHDQKIWITTKIHIFTKGFKHIECGRLLRDHAGFHEHNEPRVVLYTLWHDIINSHKVTKHACTFSCLPLATQYTTHTITLQ